MRDLVPSHSSYITTLLLPGRITYVLHVLLIVLRVTVSNALCTMRFELPPYMLIIIKFMVSVIFRV